MKKLMIAAAIVCAAVVSQAAAFDWTVGAIAVKDADGKDVAAVGGKGYWVDGTKFEAFSALSADKIAAWCAENNLYTANIVTGRGGATATASSGSYNPGDTITGFAVIVDANGDYYANTGVLSKSVPGSGNATLAMVYGTDTGTWASTSVDVPEPTSGLLLLIGVAGLALRRRRA